MIDWYEETETPSPYEDGRCVHNGLFATNPPEGVKYPEPAYWDWLDSTVRCDHCGQDVPNHEL